MLIHKTKKSWKFLSLSALFMLILVTSSFAELDYSKESISDFDSYSIESSFDSLNGISILRGDYEIKSAFHEGYAVVRRKSGGKYRYGVINTAGNIKVPFVIDAYNMAPCSDGLFLIQDKESSYSGYMNINGKMITDFIFTEASSFRNEYAIVSTASDRSTFGAIDTSGDFIVEEKYKAMANFSEGYACVKRFDDSIVFVDSIGLELLDPPIEIMPLYNTSFPPEFKEGLLPVISYSGFGFMNKELSLTFITRTIFPYPFSEGMAMLSIGNPNGKGEIFGYMNKNGKIVVEPTYRKGSNFSEDLALVSDDNYKQGFINKSGNLVIPFTDDYYMESFKDGVSVCRRISDLKYGAINKKGRLVIPFDYEYIGEFNEGSAPATLDGKYVMIFSPESKSYSPSTTEINVSNKIERPKRF